MRVVEMDIPDVKVIEPRQWQDNRGWFSETFDKETFKELDLETGFVLDTRSQSAEKGTIRGLHFQVPPHAQAKLVQVTRGTIFDVALDIRKGSPTFGRHVSVRIDADNQRQILVPVGFAHGFCTLADDTEVCYKNSDHFYPDDYKGILWNDPDLGIEWPVSETEAILSPKDWELPSLKDIPDYFEFAG